VEAVVESRRDEEYENNVVNESVAIGRKGRKLAQRLNIAPDFRFDYKDPQLLRYFISDRGRIVPRRQAREEYRATPVHGSES
jgi:ribosomal protein S18